MHRFADALMLRVERVIGCITATLSNDASSMAMRVLVNPANEALIGTSRPYFPRGGPVPARPPPELGTSSTGWGGMDAGSGMLYPAQTVDGIVHQYGGRALRSALAKFPALLERADGDHIRCHIGDAVLTASPASLPYDVIAHTPPPFWPTSLDESSLGEHAAQVAACFHSALDVSRSAAAAADKMLLLTTPLIGAGARGAPAAAAASILVRACAMAQREAVAEALDGVDVVVRLVAHDRVSDEALQQAALREGLKLVEVGNGDG